jgi:hypothetical protein
MMFSMAVLGPWGPLISGVGSFLTSRLGNVVLAASIAYSVAHFREKHAWELSVATQQAAMRAAHAEEVAREANAAREIGAAAVARAEDDDAVVANLNKQIEQLKALEKKDVPAVPDSARHCPKIVPCSLDAARIERLRRFDASGHRASSPAKRSR